MRLRKDFDPFGLRSFCFIKFLLHIHFSNNPFSGSCHQHFCRKLKNTFPKSDDHQSPNFMKRYSSKVRVLISENLPKSSDYTPDQIYPPNKPDPVGIWFFHRTPLRLKIIRVQSWKIRRQTNFPNSFETPLPKIGTRRKNLCIFTDVPVCAAHFACGK